MGFEIRKNYHQKNYHKFILFIYLFLKTFWVVHSKKKEVWSEYTQVENLKSLLLFLW